MNCGYAVGSVDLDGDQATLSHFLENRKRHTASGDSMLSMPEHRLVEPSQETARADAEEDEAGRVAEAFEDLLDQDYIVIELMFVQKFMRLIGYPLYTYSVVIFTMLLAAGCGSMLAEKMDINPARRWWLPFIGIFVMGILMWFFQGAVANYFLAQPLPIRCLVAGLMIFPIGLFMGMPFPLGILAIQKMPDGAIAWAWAMNGLLTVIGGVASVALSIFIGFHKTLLLALLVYVLAMFVYAKLRKATGAAAPEPKAS